MLAVLVCALGWFVGASELRVLVIDWITDDYSGPFVSYNPPVTTAIDINFVLAMKHFNDRNVEIFPALASVLTCDINLTIAGLCDDTGKNDRAAAVMSQMEGLYDVVVGVSANTYKVIAPIAHTFANAPVIGYWTHVTKESSDYIELPMFSETYVANSDYAEKLADFVVFLNITAVACLVENSDILPDLNFAMVAALQARSRSIDVISYFFISEDDVSLDYQLGLIANTGRNLIIYEGWESTINRSLWALAAQHGLNSSSNIWLFTNGDTVPVAQELAANPALAEFLSGSFHIDFASKSETVSKNYLSKFHTEFAQDPTLVPLINSIFPPLGSQNETYNCLDRSLNYSIAHNYFHTIDLSLENFLGFSAYDAMMTAGLAACAPGSGDLFSKIQDISFEGMSGPVRFSKKLGRTDRAVQTVLFTLANWRPDPVTGIVAQERVGTWDGSGPLVLSSPLMFRESGSVTPPTYLKPVEVFYYLPWGLKILGIVETSILLLLSLLAWVFVYRNRTNPVMRRNQPLVLYWVCVACATASLAILFLSSDDDPTDPLGWNNASCAAVPSLFFLSFSFLMGGLIAKTYRLESILAERNTLKTSSIIRIRHVFLFALGCMLVTLSILIPLWVVGDVTLMRVPLTFDKNGYVTLSQAQCDSPSYPGFLGALVAVFIIQAILLRVVSRGPRHTAMSTLALACLQAFIVAIPAVIAVYDVVVARFVVLSTLILFFILAVLLTVFSIQGQILEELRARALAQEIAKRTPTGQAPDVDVYEGLKNPMVAAKFEHFATDAFVLESYYFLVTLIKFEQACEAHNQGEALQIARVIILSHIQSGSLLEVNISGMVRSRTLEDFTQAEQASTSPSPSLFLKAKDEVRAMLNPGAWGEFLDDGGMYRVQAEAARMGGHESLLWGTSTKPSSKSSKHTVTPPISRSSNLGSDPLQTNGTTTTTTNRFSKLMSKHTTAQSLTHSSDEVA